MPVEDTGRLIDWGNQMIGNTDPDYSEHLITDPDSDQYKHLPFRSPAALEVFEYGRELARQRKGGDGTDLISILVNRTPEDGEPLSATDFDNYFLLLVIAGNETTRHTISQSMLALIENPDQLELLQEQPELIPNAVEEFLRWASPVYHFRRTATRDVELAASRSKPTTRWSCGSPRATGTSRFEDPYRLDVTRTNRSPDVRQGQPAHLPGQRLGPDGDPADVHRADPPTRRDRAGRRGDPGAQQLRQRHQEVSGKGRGQLTAPHVLSATALPFLSRRGRRATSSTWSAISETTTTGKSRNTWSVTRLMLPNLIQKSFL